jgi:hypothetical protein
MSKKMSLVSSGHPRLHWPDAVTRVTQKNVPSRLDERVDIQMFLAILSGRKWCHVSATSTPHQRHNFGQCHMAMNFIQTCGDVEWDAGPPMDDVEAGKSDVEAVNADVACHVSRGMGGIHSTVTFSRTSLRTRLCFARHPALTARCPPRCHGSSRTVSSCSYCWTSPCGGRRYS